MSQREIHRIGDGIEQPQAAVAKDEPTELTPLDNERRQRIRKAKRKTGYRPCLYLNEKDGIVAVLTPDAMQESNLTAPPGWRGPLFPARQTYVFASAESAIASIHQNAGDEACARKIAGTVDDLQKLALLYEIDLLRDERIFVPWIDQDHLTFARQADILADCAGTDLYKELVARQFPTSNLAELLAL